MNQRLTTQQLRSLLRPEAALVELMLVGLVAWYVLDQRVGDAQEEEEAIVQRQVTAARDDLTHWETSYSVPALQEEIDQLQSILQEQVLPAHQEALAFRTAISSYSAERQLLLRTFERLESAPPKDDTEETPSVHYSIVARGTEDALVGALLLLEGFPTAVVQQLEFTRVLESPAEWEMLLELDVFYVAEQA